MPYSSAFSQQCNTYEVKYDHYLNGVRDKLLALPWANTKEVLMSIKAPKCHYFLESLSTNSATVSTCEDSLHYPKRILNKHVKGRNKRATKAQAFSSTCVLCTASFLRCLDEHKDSLLLQRYCGLISN